MINDYRGKAVLVTGGTAGIGLSTGLAFGQAGAQVYLTYKWGSEDEESIRQEFVQVGALDPILVQADVSSEEDTITLLKLIRSRHERIETFVSNVAFAPTINNLNDLTKRGLFTGIEYSAWPYVSYLQMMHRIFSAYPRYIVGISSAGPERFLPGYDAIAVAKSVMEVLCRYLAVRLLDADCRVNVLRVAIVKTQTLDQTFGPEFAPFCAHLSDQHCFVEQVEVGKAVLGLCSGLLDSLSGQVITLDNGFTFADNIGYLYQQRERNGIRI